MHRGIGSWTLGIREGSPKTSFDSGTTRAPLDFAERLDAAAPSAVAWGLEPRHSRAAAGKDLRWEVKNSTWPWES
jgi:hypothetical protein